MSTADLAVVVKQLALPVGLALGVVVGLLVLRARRTRAARQARDAAIRERLMSRSER